MQNIAYILPAFGEKPTEAPYRRIAATLKGRGYSVVPVPIVWDRRVLTDWVHQVEAAIGAHGSPHLIFGFSFGALTALVVSARYPVKKLVICSPSPYFAEDLGRLPPMAGRILGKRRMEDFLKYSAKGILPKVRARVRIVVGEKDFPLLIQRVGRTVRMLPHGKAIMIKGAVHDISDAALLGGCLRAIGEMG